MLRAVIAEQTSKELTRILARTDNVWNEGSNDYHGRQERAYGLPI